ILNACTDAERVDVQVNLPYLLCDGSLPPLGSELVVQTCPTTTTTTTLAGQSCSAADDCPDGPACTTKSCVSGQCGTAPFTGIPLADCRLAATVGSGACGGDPIDPALRKTLDKKVAGMRAKLASVTDPTAGKGRKRVRQIAKQLKALSKRAGRAKKTSPTC